jgi:hypothetical protein
VENKTAECMVHFKFNPGDLVHHKGSLNTWMVVLSQLAEVGAGVPEPSYMVSWIDRSGNLQRDRLVECEIAPAKPTTLTDAMEWVKDLAVSEQNFEAAAVARKAADDLLKLEEKTS